MDKLNEKLVSPMHAKFRNDVALDTKLFKRVKAVYDKRKKIGLNPEQIRLVEQQYDAFVKNGALLDKEGKKKLRQLDKELAQLKAKFAINVKAAQKSFELVVTDKKKLKGLPEAALEMAAEEAKKRKKPEGSFVFTLDYPSVLPVLQYADNRSLRRTINIAWRSVAFGGKHDNQQVVLDVVNRRHERAVLLGHKTHAEYVLESRMAKNPETVWSFLDGLLSYAKSGAMKDLTSLTDYSVEHGGPEILQAWDTTYYSEKLKKELFDFNSEELRPYFKLENVIKGVFLVAKKLYGLKFRLVKVPVYHKDVKVYEVKDEKGKYLGLLYTDFFPRSGTKQTGAWMDEIRTQGYHKGKVRPAHVGLFCNFRKSTATQPSLLSLGEVETFFHEFGHCLHGLLSQCTYKSIAGANTKWDFVELPSQIMENWANEQKSLDLFARHYKTGKKMPAELLEKIKKSQNFLSGMMSLRQLSFGYLDMAWHDCNPSRIKNVAAFERQATARTKILDSVPGTCMTCSFGHLFNGGYSAGYYSYLWAEVLEADAFALFKLKGLFNRKVAKAFRDCILSRGDTEDPMVLFKRFRGRAPNQNALLRREGLKR